MMGKAPAAADVDKNQPSQEDIRQAEETASQAEKTIPAENPQKPEAILEETAEETADRHAASTELPVGELTDPETQADDALAEDAKEKIVPGAAAGPLPGGTVVNDEGKVAYAPPGSYNAARSGVQEDAAGHVDSTGTDNSSRSGTRA
jgi:hypothetical protein